MNSVLVYSLELFKSRCSGTKITRLSWILGLMRVIPQTVLQERYSPNRQQPSTMPSSAKDFTV